MEASHLTVIVCLTMFATTTQGIWLLADTDPERIAVHPTTCGMVPGLSMRQREVCARNPDVMKYVIDGLRMALTECEYAFHDQIWNCSMVAKGSHLKVASKESAYVYAISSAGVSHALAKACSKGFIEDCGCGPTPATKNPKFVWAGCSDNVRYGNAFGRRFIDVNDRLHSDARALMNLHNNRVGRRLLANGMVKQCKCHGVSGSCVTKTCWKVVPKFEDFALKLKEKYELAQQVTVEPNGDQLMVRAPTTHQLALGARRERFLQPTVEAMAGRNELVYLDESPDYCKGETQGRECADPASCRQLCCGRGWHSVREVVDEPCHCKFIWCCEVKCKTCKKVVDRHYCR